MTGEIFSALEMRFNSSSTLVTTGRKLYQGFDEERKNVVRPYTEVTLEKVRDLGTWDADIDEWDLRFRYHAKDLRTLAADTWLGAMRAMFKDAGTSLNNYAFTCAGIREGVAQAPTQKDSAYDAAIRFTITVQWRVMSPMTRGG